MYNPSLGTLNNMFRRLYTIARQNEIRVPCSGKCVVDEHFNGLLMYLWDKDTAERESRLRFFRGVVLAELGYEPDYSFYLYKPFIESITRGRRRDNRPVESFDHPWWLAQRDEKLLELATDLQCRVPYFHVIDGDGPIEVVAERVLEVLDERTV